MLSSVPAMPIELESPTGLTLMGLLVPLVLLYILRVKKQRRTVASTWLWAAAERDLLAQRPFRRLVAQLPLVLESLALVLLAVAVSRPTSRGGAMMGNHVALVIDTSASMAGSDGTGPSRLALAKEAALRLIGGLGQGADALVIEAGRTPSIAAPLDRDRRRLKSAIDLLVAHPVEGNLESALALASDRLRQLPGARRVVLLSDHHQAPPGTWDRPDLPVELITVGEPLDNTALIRIDVRSGRDPSTKKDQVQAFALVGNYGKAPRDLFVTLRQRQVKEPLASRRLQLGPGEQGPVVLTFEPTPGDLGSGLVVELSPADGSMDNVGLAFDDRAYGRIPPGRRLPTVLAPPNANLWMRRALEADPDVALETVDPSALDSAAVPSDALIVTDGICPAVTSGADWVILNPPRGPCLGLRVGSDLPPLNVTSWAESDPRFRFINLDGVQIVHGKRLEVESEGASLVRTREGPIMADVSTPGRSATLLSFDVGDSNWPLKASFVLFVRNLLERARDHRQRGITGPARTGEPISIRVPAEVSTVQVEIPNGQLLTVPARLGIAVLPDTRQSGFYHVSWQGRHPGSTLVVANLSSETESDLRGQAPDLAHPARPNGAGPATVPASPTEWAWLLGAGVLLLIAADVAWLTRRPRSSKTPLLPRLPNRPSFSRQAS